MERLPRFDYFRHRHKSAVQRQTALIIFVIVSIMRHIFRRVSIPISALKQCNRARDLLASAAYSDYRVIFVNKRLNRAGFLIKISFKIAVNFQPQRIDSADISCLRSYIFRRKIGKLQNNGD